MKEKTNNLMSKIGEYILEKRHGVIFLFFFVLPSIYLISLRFIDTKYGIYVLLYALPISILFFLPIALFLILLDFAIGKLDKLYHQKIDQQKFLEQKNKNQIAIRESTYDIKYKQIKETKNKILRNGTVKFYYLNKEVIESSYNNLFKQDRISQVTKESIVEFSNAAKADLQIKNAGVSAEVANKKSEKTTQETTPAENSEEEKLIKLIHHLIDKDELKIGVENTDREYPNIDEFDLLINQLKSKFGIEIDKNKYINKRHELLKESSSKIIDRLSDLNGNILIIDDFRVEKGENHYKFILWHTVNFYYNSKNHITITFVMPKIAFNEETRFLFDDNSSINLIVFGRVIKQIAPFFDVNEMKIEPFAIW